MRIDLPGCDLKTCRFCQDHNCTDNNRYENCEYAIARVFKERAMKGYECYSFPEKAGDYRALMVTLRTSEVYTAIVKYDGSEFKYEPGDILIGWKVDI